MIIKKEYGGFSAYAQSVYKTCPASPDSGYHRRRSKLTRPRRGCLQHYGTEGKKKSLSAATGGRKIPCFALTGPEAGSRCERHSDTGVVCMGEWRQASRCWVRLTSGTSVTLRHADSYRVGPGVCFPIPDRLL